MRPNPLVRRELNLRMREWNAFWLPLTYLGTLTFVFGQLYASTQQTPEPWRQGQELFKSLSTASLMLLFLAIPVLAGAALTSEREQRTLISLLMTRLSARQIVYGKLCASVAYSALLLATSLPLLAVAHALCGVSSGLIGLHYLSLGTSAVTLAAAGLTTSAWFKRSAYSIAVCYGLLAFLVITALSIVGVLAELEAVTGVRLLRPLAFASPLFFLDENNRWQWPLHCLSYLGIAGLLAELAARRLSKERTR